MAHPSFRQSAAVVAILLVAVLSACSSAASPTNTPSASATRTPYAAATRAPAAPPKTLPTLAADATCSSLASLSGSDRHGAIAKAFGVNGANQSAVVNVMCSIELPGTTPIVDVIEGSGWATPVHSTVTIESGTYAGYTLEVTSNPRRVLAGEGSPATRLGMTTLPVGVDGSVTIRNTTPNRSFPVSAIGLEGIVGAYPPDSAVCTKTGLEVKADEVCRVWLSKVNPGATDLAPTGAGDDIALVPAGSLTVADADVEVVANAVKMPVALAWIWSSPDLRILNSCSLPISFGTGDRAVAVAMPADRAPLFCQ